MSSNIKSVLRYPGGKTRAIKLINPLIPRDYIEFREPFVGGGSVFIDAIQTINPSAKYIINDLNFDLYCFWKYLKEDANSLYQSVLSIKESGTEGRKLFTDYTQNDNYTEFERAVRFFVLNRITFSGTVDSGGYSEGAFKGRFTMSSLERLLQLAPILSDVEICNKDYSELLFDEGDNVFIFLDPPYYSQSKSRLYGRRGNLHTGFDHQRFADDMRLCKHNWLITLDDCEENRELFKFANIYSWELQYGMNNYKSETAAKGKELFISNYDLSDVLKTTNHSAHISVRTQQLSLFDD
ncbi:MAG: DNA adenine methylase [Oscillospiraceae bacterium]|nr:DNA adenine methylase [Oscillospiraceae bacterium]